METCPEWTSDPGRWGGRQWSILSLPSIHSIPAQQPMKIRPWLISRTRLTTAGFISRPHQAGSKISQNDLVETTSLGHLPSSALSGCVETTSLGHPHIPELAKARTQSSPVSKQKTFFDWPSRRSYLPPTEQLPHGVTPPTDPSMRSPAWLSNWSGIWASSSSLNLPHPVWGPASSHTRDPEWISRAWGGAFWITPVPWHAWQVVPASLTEFKETEV